MDVGTLLENLSQQITTCRPEDTMQTIATVLTAKGIGALPVCDENGAMVGIISERDLVTAFSKSGAEAAGLRVRDVMTTKVISCGPEDSLDEARAILQKHRFRHLPVVDGTQMIGILSIRDLLLTSLEESQFEVSVLKDSVIAARFR